MIAAAYEEKRSGRGVGAAELNAVGLNVRLATIEVDAAVTLARVVELEREYLERVKREDAGEVAPPAAQSSTPVVVNPSDITP